MCTCWPRQRTCRHVNMGQGCNRQYLHVLYKLTIRRIYTCLKGSTMLLNNRSSDFSKNVNALHSKRKQDVHLNCISSKMLGLYLYTLIICHKSDNMLSILNTLTLQKKLQHFVTNIVLLDKKVKTQQQQNKNQIKNTCRSRKWNAQSGCVTYAPPSQLRVKIVVKLFNCFDAIGRNVNTAEFAGHTITKSVIFLHAWITIFCSFSYLREKVSMLKYSKHLTLADPGPRTYDFLCPKR